MIKTLMLGFVILIFSGCSDPYVDSAASNNENVIAATERVLYTEHYFPALNKKPLHEDEIDIYLGRNKGGTAHTKKELEKAEKMLKGVVA